MTERIEKIKIDALIPFENHPFKERTGEEQAELVESIRTTGMLVPVIVRPLLRGKYEIISGHRRVAACRELGVDTIPAIVGTHKRRSGYHNGGRKFTKRKSATQ